MFSRHTVLFALHWIGAGPLSMTQAQRWASAEWTSLFTGIYLVIASVIRLTMHAQRTCYVGRCWFWSRVSDPGPTLDRYWYSVSCLLVCAFIAQQTRHVDPSTTPGQHWPSARSTCRVCWVCSKEKIYIVSVSFLKGGPPVSGHLLTLRRVSLTTCIPNTLYRKCI